MSTRPWSAQNKRPDYFEGIRRDIVGDLPLGRGLGILEVGCGAGATLELARSLGKAARTVGIEIDPDVAAEARTRLDQVIDGNIETIDLPFAPGTFDVVILSEILEHLFNPWRTLERLRGVMKVGGLLYASSPNVAHISILRMLLRNRWDLTERGAMDWTHVRWFTPATYREMIEGAGFRVIWVKAVGPMTPKQKLADVLTIKRLSHLFIGQIFVKATLT